MSVVLTITIVQHRHRFIPFFPQFTRLPKSLTCHPSRLRMNSSDLDPHPIHGSSDPQQSASKRHLDRFIRFSTAHIRVTNTQTDRQTHRPRYVRHRYSVAIGRVLFTACMRRKAPSTTATMSKQRSTLSKQHSTLLPNGNNIERVFREISSVRQTRNKLNTFNLFRLCRKDNSSFDIVAKNGNSVEAAFDL